MSRVIVAVIALLFSATSLTAEETSTVADAHRTYSTGERVCANLSLATLTGKSPWLAMGVGGAVEHFTTPDEGRSELGFFASPWVWGTMLVLVVLVAFKDTILTTFSQLKLPLDALAEAFHATGAVVGLVFLGVAAFAPPADAPPPTALDQLRNVFEWLLMAGVHIAVWVVFNTVEVAILINPIPFVDTVLKLLRTLLIGVIAGAAALHPVFGFVFALPVILVCLWLLPRALRFLVVGWVFTADVFKRLFGVKPEPGAPVRAFAALGFRGVPVGVYGRVERSPAGYQFVYRRWFVLPWRVSIPWEQVAVATGTVPRLVEVGSGRTWLHFPPRYRGMEQELALELGLGEVRRGSIGESVGQLWRRLRERFTRKANPPAEPTA